MLLKESHSKKKITKFYKGRSYLLIPNDNNTQYNKQMMSTCVHTLFSLFLMNICFLFNVAFNLLLPVNGITTTLQASIYIMPWKVYKKRIAITV